MRILVLSDTHILDISNLPPQIINEAKKVQLCIHAGDFIDYSIFKGLSSYTRVVGVSGNMDSEEVKVKLPPKEVITLEGLKIGITHGRGAPTSLIPFVNECFREEFEEIDLFIFGHSHQPTNKKIGNKVYFNPGSPTDKIFTAYNSYGIIEITNGKMSFEIIKL